MSMLWTLFFVEACSQFSISSQRIAGLSNTLGNHLSRNQLHKFLAKFPSANRHSSVVATFFSPAVAPGPQHWLDITSSDGAVQHFCSQGIDLSTHAEDLPSCIAKVCYFLLYLWRIVPFSSVKVPIVLFCHLCQHLSRQTFKVYLAAIQHMQITLGLLGPKECCFLMPRLRMDIQHSYFLKDKDPAKLRLPITPSILYQLKAHWSPCHMNPDIVMLWAVATLCFLDFLDLVK